MLIENVAPKARSGCVLNIGPIVHTVRSRKRRTRNVSARVENFSMPISCVVDTTPLNPNSVIQKTLHAGAGFPRQQIFVCRLAVSA